MLSLCILTFYVGVGAFVIGLCQISSFLSKYVCNLSYLVERLKSSFRKFYCGYGDLIQQYKVPLSRMLNDILTLGQRWLPNRSDFPPSSWPWNRAWPSPNYERFPGSICNGTPGSVPLFGTCLCSNCWDQVYISRTCRVFTRLFTLNSPRYFLDFASFTSILFKDGHMMIMDLNVINATSLFVLFCVRVRVDFEPTKAQNKQNET